MYNAFHGVDVSTHQKRQVIFEKMFIPVVFKPIRWRYFLLVKQLFLK